MPAARCARAVVFAALLLSAQATIPALAQNTERQRFTAGAWTGAAYYTQAGDAFVQCSVSRPYDDGSILIVIRGASQFWLRIGNAAWRLTPGAKYPVRLHVDSNRSGEWTASVPPDPARTDNMSRFVDIALGNADTSIAVLQGGNRLILTAASETLEFSLAGSRAALAQLQECYQRNTAVAAATPPQNGTRPGSSANNPFTPGAGAPPRTGAPPPEDKFILERPSLQPATLRSVFKALGHDDSSVSVELTDPKSSIGWASYFYSLGPASGLYWEENSAGRKTEEIAAKVVRRLQDSCTGQFVSSIDTAEGVRDGEIRTGRTTCRRPNRNQALFFSIIDFGTRASVFLTVADEASRDAAESLDRKLREAWTQTMALYQDG
jgi:hypothetical protein